MFTYNKTLQRTDKPLRALPAFELDRYALVVVSQLRD